MTSASLFKDPSLFIEKAYINGEWITSDKTFEVVDPANGKVIGSVPDLTIADAEKAVQAAKTAFKTWSKTPPKARSDALLRWFNLMIAHSDDLAKLITLENGKPLADSLGEHKYSASFIEWYAGEAVRVYGDVIPGIIPGMRQIVIRQPIGVTALITPWNFPSAMITRKAGAALAAGCTCVIKAPSDTPFSALALVKLATEAGIPAGVLNVVTSKDRNIAKYLCEEPIVKKISFTGSTGVGKLLMKYASSTLKKLSMELGGNAPFIVFDDADLDAAVQGCMICKFRSSGQTCVCANRIFVQAGVYEEFAKKLTAAVAKLKIGPGLDTTTTHGPMIHGKAVDKVDEHVQDAITKGAKLLYGGKRMPELGSNFYAMTVLKDVSKDALVNEDETFGPLAALVKFETEEEVIEMSNDTPYGLAAYLYSRDIGRVFRMSEALQAGMVASNSGLMSQASIPFGGVGESGFGREGSKYGIDDYTTMKMIALGGLGV